MGTIVSRNKRRYLRYLPDEGAFALLDLEMGESFNPQVVALVSEEGYGGCGLVILQRKIPFSLGQKCRISVGNLPVVEAEIRWLNELDKDVLRMGLCYLFGDNDA